jgi:hypothetical protein
MSWRSSILVFTVLAGAAVHAQDSQPLGPHADKIKALVGVWKLEGTVQPIEATGASDAGPVSYTQVGRLVNDGAIVQVQRTGTGPRGPVEELWLFTYNPVTGTYRMDGTTGRNVVRNFMLEIEGDRWTFEGTNTTPAGVTTRERFTIVYTPDMTSGTVRSEHSMDSRRWFERLTGTYTRVPNDTTASAPAGSPPR